MNPDTNPYTPVEHIAASQRALAAWDAMTLDQQTAALKAMGLLDANGDLHPDYDWTPERYAQEFGHAAK